MQKLMDYIVLSDKELVCGECIMWRPGSMRLKGEIRCCVEWKILTARDEKCGDVSERLKGRRKSGK